MNIACSGRHIHYQIIEFAPIRVVEKLDKRIGSHRTTPEQGFGRINKKTNGQQLDTMLFHGVDNTFAVLFYHFGMNIQHIEHQRDGRPVNVGIEQANFCASAGQGNGKISRNGGFSHTTFAGSNGNDIFHLCQLAFGLLP